MPVVSGQPVLFLGVMSRCHIIEKLVTTQTVFWGQPEPQKMEVKILCALYASK